MLQGSPLSSAEVPVTTICVCICPGVLTYSALSDPHSHCKQCFPRLDGLRGKHPWQGLSSQTGLALWSFKWGPCDFRDSASHKLWLSFLINTFSKSLEHHTLLDLYGHPNGPLNGPCETDFRGPLLKKSPPGQGGKKYFVLWEPHLHYQYFACDSVIPGLTGAL